MEMNKIMKNGFRGWDGVYCLSIFCLESVEYCF